MAIDQYGQIIRRSPRPIPIRTNPNIDYNPGISYSSYSHTPWERFNNFIGGIGNWIANVSDTITGILVWIIIISIAIPFIGWLISLGWIWGIVAGLFLGGIVYYAALIVAGIIVIISNIVLAVFRYIFYSGITFLVTLAIIGVLCGVSKCSSSNPSPETIQNTYNPVQTTKYRCTARSQLKVRSAPNRYASVVGTIGRNEVVDVYEIVDGFARIRCNNKDGYASVQYLEQQY